MIYLFTALYEEASVFIKQFHLEKDLESTRFQEFYNQEADIRLMITGVGEIAAAAAVGSVCTKHKPREGDVLLNIGTCAHMAGGDGIFLCNKLIEPATGKTFYPDILYRHDFCEEAIVTGMQPWNGDRVGRSAPALGGALYDMEAAAIYQAGAYFFGPHQMMFLKIVSDSGSANEVSKKQLVHLMEEYQGILIDFIRQIAMLAHKNTQQEKRLQQEKEALVERLCADMHCSKTMRASLEQHIHYLSLAGADYALVIRDLYQEGLLPCKDKREGKLRFEELRKRLY